MIFRIAKYWGAQPYDGPLGPKIGGGGLEPRRSHGVGAYVRNYIIKGGLKSSSPSIDSIDDYDESKIKFCEEQTRII